MKITTEKPTSQQPNISYPAHFKFIESANPARFTVLAINATQGIIVEIEDAGKTNYKVGYAPPEWVPFHTTKTWKHVECKSIFED